MKQKRGTSAKPKPFYRALYRHVLPLISGLAVGQLIPRLYPESLDASNFFLLLASIFISALFICIILAYFESVIFGRKNDLVSKMMKCTLRKQYGLDYCVKCPDSYSCPAEGK